MKIYEWYIFILLITLYSCGLKNRNTSYNNPCIKENKLIVGHSNILNKDTISVDSFQIYWDTIIAHKKIFAGINQKNVILCGIDKQWFTSGLGPSSDYFMPNIFYEGGKGQKYFCLRYKEKICLGMPYTGCLLQMFDISADSAKIIPFKIENTLQDYLICDGEVKVDTFLNYLSIQIVRGYRYREWETWEYYPKRHFYQRKD